MIIVKPGTGNDFFAKFPQLLGSSGKWIGSRQELCLKQSRRAGTHRIAGAWSFE